MRIWGVVNLLCKCDKPQWADGSGLGRMRRTKRILYKCVCLLCQLWLQPGWIYFYGYDSYKVRTTQDEDCSNKPDTLDNQRSHPRWSWGRYQAWLISRLTYQYSQLHQVLLISFAAGLVDQGLFLWRAKGPSALVHPFTVNVSSNPPI